MRTGLPDGVQLSDGAWPGSLAVSFSGFHTKNSITIDEGPGARELLLWAAGLCADLHATFAPRDPQSELARINAGTGIFELSCPMAELLSSALSFSQEEPAFDCTIGASSFLWKWTEGLPSDEEVERARMHTGAQHLVLNGRTLEKRDPSLRLDFGSCAKGYAADKIAARFREEGVCRADIDLGGNLYLLGQHPENRPWHLVVDLPDGLRPEPIAFEVTDSSVVTSSCLERPLVKDGMRFHHLIDPRTGRPSRSNVASATVVSKSSLEADMLSTALLIGGMEAVEGRGARYPGCGFIAVDSTGSMRSAGEVNLRG
ncbi:MAG: FAD:protein FMN transferase [Coriobacteriales bacterium]|jgi:thiamine biosynthesis lipoprotein